jgi:L-alanine-DL-glutamate epimerase-like enolase superfamily enzyme
MKIERIEAIPVRLPYRTPVHFALGVLTSAEHVVLRVHASNGIVGVAEAMPRPMIYGETIASVVGAVESVISPLLCNHDVSHGFDLRRRLKNVAGNNTLLGALDIALWDIASREMGLPLWKVLGGDGGALDVNGAIGMGEIDAIVRAALEQTATYGLKGFLIKVGGDLAHDMAMCRALRDALPHAVLHADANHSYMPTDAVKFARCAADIGMAWIEEPVAFGVAGRDWYRQHTSVPTSTDETTPDLFSVARAVVSGETQIVALKVARTGITESMQISGLCEALGAGLWIHTQGDSDIGNYASLQFAALGPQHRRYTSTIAFSTITLGDQLVTTPLEIKNGQMVAPNSPGVGCELDLDKLKHYSI